MAHTCPYCGMLCHCKGDIDDIDLGHEPRGGCEHFLREHCDENWEDDEYSDDEVDDFYDEGLPKNPKL